MLKPHPPLDFTLNQSSEAELISFHYHSKKGLFNEQFSSVLLMTSCRMVVTMARDGSSQ